MVWLAHPFPGIMGDFYVRVTIVVTGLCFVETVTDPSRKSNISLHPEYQSNGDLLANWSSTRHISQKADTMDGSFYFFRVLFQPHEKKEHHRKVLDRTSRVSKVTLGPLSHFRALEILNLSNNAIYSLSLHRSRSHSQLPWLKVLILQRNQLHGTPEGEQFERILKQRKSRLGTGVLCQQEFCIYVRFQGRGWKSKAVTEQIQ